MRDIFRQRMMKRTLAKQGHLRQHFRFHGLNPTLRKHIQPRRPWRQRYPLDTGGSEHLLEGGTELRVAVMDEIRAWLEDSTLVHCQVARHLLHPRFVRMRRHPGDMDLSGL